MQVTIHHDWQEYDASLQLGTIEAEVNVIPFDQALWNKIVVYTTQIRKMYASAQIPVFPNIAAGRNAYKTLGQDPARYRLSAEALWRRVLKGKDLYQINNVVDTVNYTSLHSGISIGGYDMANIKGDAKLGIGIQDEPYEAIGKGTFNIAKIPVLRDEEGAFGTPTSDSARTAVGEGTKRFLMVFFAFSGTNHLDDAMKIASDLLMEHARSSNPVMNKISL